METSKQVYSLSRILSASLILGHLVISEWIEICLWYQLVTIIQQDHPDALQLQICLIEVSLMLRSNHILNE